MKNINSLVTVCLLISVISSCKKPHTLPDPLEAGWKGQKVCKVIEESETLRVLMCRFEPGVGHEKHYHKPHFGYAISGSTFRIEDKTGIK